MRPRRNACRTSRGVSSNGVKFYLADHSEDERLFNTGKQDVAYRHFLDWLGGLLSEEIGVLFNPNNSANRLYPTQKAVRVLGSRALHSRSPALGCALHEWRVSLIADRDGRDVMAAQDGARKHGGRADAYVFCLISDWRGVRRLLVAPSGPSHQVALGLRLDFVPAPPRG